MPVGFLSDLTTNFSNVSLNGLNSANMLASTYSGPAAAISSISGVRIAVPSGLIASSGSLDLRTNTVVISLDTRANASSMTIGQLRIVFAASGISLMYSSGATSYLIAGSTTSAVQA